MVKNNILSDPEIRRFSSQIALPQIGVEGQEKLKMASVAVIGAGGIGTSVLQYLSASGIGNLGIIDFALVEESNMQIQTLYGGNDLGKLKSIISKQQLQNLFPLINFEIINLQLTSNNINRIIEPFKFVVDATNDPVSHKIIDEACEKLNLPWVYASVNGFEGQVSVLNAAHKATYQNILSANKEMEQHSVYNKGLSPLTYGIIGDLMALEVIKWIVGIPGSLVNKLLSVDLLSYQFTVKTLSD